MNRKLYLLFCFLFGFSALSFAQEVTVTDATLGSGTYNWTKDNVYILDGLVYLEAGGTLNIEAGTVVKAKALPETGDATTALIITRGATINALGSASEPIIFTSDLDDLEITDDLTALDNQTWGGIIILGAAPIGEDINPDVGYPTDVIEGIVSTETRIQYGGTDPDDNSGVLKYVSIRHGGSILGADNEINGLTLGGVGAGTEIDYVEVFANKDDGIEIFGGTVNVKHAVVAFCGDDSYDFDESWDGYVQFALSLQQSQVNEVGDHAIEYDGSEAADKSPQTVGRIYNGTFIGSGVGSANTSSNGLRLRSDGAAQFWNNIWLGSTDYMFRIDDTSVDRLGAGESAFANNIVFGYGSYVSGDNQTVLDALTAGNTDRDLDPSLGGVSRMPDSGLDPRPNGTSPALTGAAIPSEAGVEVTVYRGAFGNTGDWESDNWALGWTALDSYGYMSKISTDRVRGENVIQDVDIEAGETLTLTANNVYTLDGFVYVESGATLIIEAGTVIKASALPTTGDPTSALIIARGGKIIANGRADAPIIFTSDLDDLSVTDDLTALDNQTWGGVIILGSAPIGEDVNPDLGYPTDVIEGIVSTEPRIQYGGTDPDDDSGILKYVSIRHGGSILGADNEINGLTLGGVGAGTEIDYVEVFANKDDGIEIFGGTVNVKHAVVAFCGDDSYDFDESWDGHVQFALSLQQDQVNEVGDHAIEYDGSEAADKSPQTVGRIYNGTFIGSGVGSANTSSNGLRLRSDGAAQFWNNIWLGSTDYMFRIDDTSVDRLGAGESAFANNMVFSYGSYVSGDNQTVLDALTAGNTDRDLDPDLGGVSRTPNGMLDPRPNGTSPALTGAAIPSEDGVEITIYRGAFGNTGDWASDNWALGWTAMDSYGYFSDEGIATPPPSEDLIIRDEDIEAGETLTLTANNEYTMDGFVYVETGATLIIEAGTVIKAAALPTTGDPTSALIITRGGKIIANGRADAPIIFTSDLDDLSVTDDLTALDNQTWGGVIILGSAPIGEDVNPDLGYPTDVIEGIVSTEPRIQYGGTDPDDNSGIFKYVSIRHGGSILGADNEINGLTLGGVGAGTDIDYVEVFANKDDGIEIFGGTVNVKHAVVAFCGDDSYDFDESWDGFVQFALSVQQDQVNEVGDHAIEYDGSEAADKTPKTVGRIYNGTFIGSGVGSANTSSNGLRLRSDAAAQFWNNIWLGSTDYMFRIDDTSVDRLGAGESAFANNIVFGYGSYVSGDDATVLAALTAGNTQKDVDPDLGGISRTPNGMLDPRPNATSPALTGAATPSEAGVVRTIYRGAFDNADNWALGWTAMDSYGYFGNLNTKLGAEDLIIRDEDIEAGETLTLTANNTYFMDGFVYVEEGATLIIEAGTVIKAQATPTTGDPTSALIITRGGKIIANGRADAPIIFTSDLDDLNATDDLTALDNQTWGGVIILGSAPIGEDVNPDLGYPTDVIEGIVSTEPRIQYGGTDPDDNSGIFKYVSIRHGGSILGADNEINGLTLGGVGAGTEIDYIEVFANKDDGIEIFGGTVNIKHTVVAFCGDDSYDFDESWDGSMQFLLSLQQDQVNEVGDHAVEYDGSEAADKTPKTVGRIYNATFIGSGVGSANTSSNGLRLRSDGAAQFWNVIWLDATDYMFRIDDTSVDRLGAGESAFANNIVFGYGSYVSGDDATVLAALTAGGTEMDVDPNLGGISRTPNGGLDPRPNDGSPALRNAVFPMDDDFITVVDYRGAFGNDENWALGWTALDSYGYFGDLATPVTGVYEVGQNTDGVILRAPYPNPAYGETVTVEFILPKASEAAYRVFDITGRLLDGGKMGVYQEGNNQFNLDITNYTNGLYVIALETELGGVTQKFAVYNRKR